MHPETGKERFVWLRFDCGISKRFSSEQADPHLEKGVARLKQIEGLMVNTSSRGFLFKGVRRHEILSLAPADEQAASMGQDDRWKKRSVAPKNKD